MAYLRSIPTIDSNLFTWDKQFKMLHAEISTLQGNGLRGLYGQIYDDACDVGIKIRSRRTEEDVIFYLADEVRNDDDEIQEWIFLPVEEFVRKNPKLAFISVNILND